MSSRRVRMRKHTAARARQRFGIHLPYLKQLEIVQLIIADDENIVLLQKRQKRSVLAIKWENRWLPAVFDFNKKALVTILPRQAFKKYKFNPEEAN